MTGNILETKQIGLPIGTSGTHNNTVFDNTLGVIRLSIIENDSNGNPVYADSGYWTSEVINLGDRFNDFDKVFTSNVDTGSSSISIETRVSDDGVVWSDWNAVAYDGTILSVTKQYIQIKINLFAGFASNVFLVSDFNNANDASLFTPNEFIDTSNGLKLKRNYSYDMTRDTTWTDTGTLFRKVINRNDFLRIDNLNVVKK